MASGVWNASPRSSPADRCRLASSSAPISAARALAGRGGSRSGAYDPAVVMRSSRGRRPPLAISSARQAATGSPPGIDSSGTNRDSSSASDRAAGPRANRRPTGCSDSGQSRSGVFRVSWDMVAASLGAGGGWSDVAGVVLRHAKAAAHLLDGHAAREQEAAAVPVALAMRAPAAVGLDDLELDQPVVQRALVAQGGAALAPVHGEVHHARGALVLVVVPDPVGGEGFDTHVSLQWAKVGGGRVRRCAWRPRP